MGQRRTEREIRKVNEMNENKKTTYLKLWDTVKAGLRGNNSCKLFIYLFVCLTWDFLKKSSFRFTAKLRGRYSYFPYISCPHTFIASPIINISLYSGTFVTLDDPIHHNYPKPIVRVQSWCTFYEFGQMYNDM